ncbi:hypothetical protein [Polycladidibacter hongkongensis]|uniref:hypothetical protein n=1 Tax=Polycladidibacter hongkongensis TaxID=1647556 RepID=UPI000A65576D|nr:hypothetical protein [Pseudovibrio hongkongensis]
MAIPLLEEIAAHAVAKPDLGAGYTAIVVGGLIFDFNYDQTIGLIIRSNPFWLRR